MEIHNSLTNKKETFLPVKDQEVRIYSCGVTVYDQCHIGHARSLYVNEIIRRHLQWRGYRVRFVRNITDVDDKIIKKALETGRSWQEVVDENIRSYQQDLQRLGIGQADIEPRATDNIPEMIHHIEGLLAKGYAYVTDGDVYFRVRHFRDYGKLSGQSVEKMLEAVRIEKDEKKEDPLDFALWKRSKPGEPSWPSPWGEGRPGWHIECSCMSMKHLGTTTLDIHAGGRDLIFPHHENEIAQSEALTEKPFARFWIHNGLLTIHGSKMAKSLGNFITIQDALKRYQADDLKIFFLLSHYSSVIDYTEEKMAEAHRVWERFDIFFKEAGRLGERSASGAVTALASQTRDDFVKAMDDDFNTPRAMGVLFEALNETYKLKSRPDYADVLASVKDVILTLVQQVFGIFQPAAGAQDLELQPLEGTKTLKDFLQERLQAKARKDFRRSDEIRGFLRERGIIVEDTKDGQVWRRA